MNILALDTSTSMAGIAVTTDTAVLAESAFACDRSLSARLVPEIDRMLGQAGISIQNIDLFAASIGPGSFTGVRCGVATVQGLALATGKPCAGFSSLAMLAMNFSLNGYLICPMLDARKNEVYAALYDCSTVLPVARLNDCVMPVERFLDLLDPTAGSPVIFVGDGARKYQDTISACLGHRCCFSSPAMNVGRASHGALLALDIYQRGSALLPHLLLPTYIRPSDAEIALNNKL